MSPEVHDLLTAAGVPFAVHEHPAIVSFEDAKAVLPFDPDAMVKGLAFRTPDGRYAIVALRAVDRADYKAIADALGIRRADLRLATAEEVEAELGLVPGGVVPLPLRGATVLVDRAVPDLPLVYCGTGRREATLEIAGSALVRAAAGTIGRFAKAAPTG